MKRATKSSGGKGGRPRILAPDLTERIMLRCSKDDLADWASKAKALGLGLTTWARMRLKETKS